MEDFYHIEYNLDIRNIMIKLKIGENEWTMN